MVAPDCLGDLPSAGRGMTLTATVPADACSRLGPVSPPQTGPSPIRSRDPDATGGFYQPVRVELSGATAAIALVRIRCPLAQAPFDVALAYQSTYVNNANPHIDALRVVDATVEVTIAANATQTFPVFDIAAQDLVTTNETLTVDWYATAELATTSAETATLAPGPDGVVHVWMVLHDSRGGVDVQTIDVTRPGAALDNR